ncbi:MAG: PIN domain-containing protein [Planctomycetes bacterium]|nr:PIN domain-containing protein [Planctomycetota bacterium]
MIAVDTNLLVYAHRAELPTHQRAKGLLSELAESHDPWAIPWTCVHEFLGVVTNRRIWPVPTPRDHALAQVEVWRASPSLVFLAESDGYLPILADLLIAGDIDGPKVHDARIAALCIFHGVRELWSADRDFKRFPSLRVRNPLVR